MQMIGQSCQLLIFFFVKFKNLLFLLKILQFVYFSSVEVVVNWFCIQIVEHFTDSVVPACISVLVLINLNYCHSNRWFFKLSEKFQVEKQSYCNNCFWKIFNLNSYFFIPSDVTLILLFAFHLIFFVIRYQILYTISDWFAARFLPHDNY